MAVRFVAGDLFADPSLDALAHGCNCAGAMGKGIAVEFKQRWPAMYREYRARCRDGRFEVGDVFFWDDGKGGRIYNLGTHAHWRQPADLGGIELAVRRLMADAETRGLAQVGVPRLGAGLGGLDWRAVKRVLFRVAAKSSVQLSVFERYVAGQPGLNA